VLPEPHIMHSDTTTTPRSVWELKTLHTSTNDRISHRIPSQQQAPHCSHWRCECRQHIKRRYNNVTYVHGLFVRATVASVGVFAPQAKKSVQIRPIYRGKTGTGGALQGQELIRKSSGFHKAGVYTKQWIKGRVANLGCSCSTGGKLGAPRVAARRAAGAIPSYGSVQPRRPAGLVWQQMAEAHPISQVRRCKLSSVSRLIVANKDWLASGCCGARWTPAHTQHAPIQKTKQIARFPLASPQLGNGQLQGGGGVQYVLVSGSLLLLLSCYHGRK
jgi:hypothetical protein